MGVPIAPPRPPASPADSLRRPFHGAPVWVWLLGGGVAAAFGYRYWQARKAAQQAAAGGASSQYTDSMGLPYGGQGPLPGYTGTGIGALGGSSPTGPIIGYDGNGNPIYGVPPAGGTIPGGCPQGLKPNPDGSCPNAFPGPAPGPISGSPGPPSPGAGIPGLPPTDQYSVGQSVGPGESIVQSLFSPVFGWLNLTNKGGIYTGGGGQPGKSISEEPNGGSYLGYLASLPASQRATEEALHGTFAGGGLSLLPGGGYEETNTRGENYAFPRT